MYIFISVFYFIFNDRLYTPVAATTMPATTTIRRQRFIVRFDSISVFLVSFFYFFNNTRRLGRRRGISSDYIFR